MGWIVALIEEFEPEFDALTPSVQDELLAQAKSSNTSVLRRAVPVWTR